MIINEPQLYNQYPTARFLNDSKYFHICVYIYGDIYIYTQRYVFLSHKTRGKLSQ